MPRKRFAKLEPAKRRRILEVAEEEFATAGFRGASYNRIIMGAGVSKGAMYYYFDDKADLYQTVLRDAVARYVHALGPLGAPKDADLFWAALEVQMVRGISFYQEHPNVAALFRDLANERTGAGAAVAELTVRWMQAAIGIGQSLGAVRDDLPADLVLSVAVSLSETVDLWFARHHDQLDDAERDRMARTTTDLFRRIATPSP